MIKSGFSEKAGREDECGVCRIHRKSLLIPFSEGTGHRSDAGCKSMYACAPFNSHCSGGFTSEAAGWVPTNCKFSADETNILLFTFGFFLN